MNISIKRGKLAELSGDLLVVSMHKNGALAGAALEADALTGHALGELITRDKFEGAFGEWLVLPTFGRVPFKKIAVCGLGEKGKFDADALRKLGGQIVKQAKDAKVKRVFLAVPGMDEMEIGAREAGQAFAEGLRLGSYRFLEYKSKKDKADVSVEDVTIVEPHKAKAAQIEKGIETARILCDGIFFARDLVNTPSGHLTPNKLADAAQSTVTKGSRISIKIFDEAAMAKLGMQAALAIGSGSVRAPVGVHLVYRPKGKAKKKIALVGKAVTFDSGGLSLKPSDAMITMKSDMAGAATIIGLFKALPKLAPDVEVHGIFLAVENMPSGNACRPGDIVKAMNGTTIEILNTDAEGRVTLADALSYAQKLKPDAIIDVATLTYAVVIALGDDIAGLMTNNRKLSQKILNAAAESGEALWELPLHQPYAEHVKSKLADIKNTGAGRAAGAITAAFFLSHFVGETPWAHVDIAGPSFVEKETRADMPLGGTGFGIRLLARYLQGLS